MVLADIPEEHVPDCLQGVREKTIETEDAFFDECVKVIDRGPQVLLGDLGQYFMDTVQTPEGIASTAGNVVAIAITVDIL